MPRLTGKTLGGEYVALDDFRGRVVLLNVWATWCEPCRDELPELQRLHVRRADEGLTVLGWSVDKPQALARARSLLHQAGVQYPVVLDPDGREIEELAIRGYPTTFVVGRDGTLRWRRDGIVKPDDQELATVLRAALDEAAPQG
jgi:peroxiredoxin